MNLKEAFRYMNFLEELISKAMQYLSEDAFVTKTKEIHLKHKVNPQVEDEVFEDVNAVVDKVKSLDFTKLNFDANKIIYLMGQILAERESLSVAINKAKHNAKVDIDVAISSNKKRHEFIQSLVIMAKIKPSEIMVKGSDYKFNVSGDQITYAYDIKKYTSIDFDRNKVRKLIRDLSDKCDKVSSDIDRTLITSEVEFEPKWLLIDTFEDICECTD